MQKKLQITHIAQIVLYILLSILAVVLLFILDFKSSNAYIWFTLILLVFIPILHIFIMAFKLYYFKDYYQQKLYTEAVCAICCVIGVLYYYIVRYVDHFSDFYYLYYIALVLPYISIPVFYYLGKKKEEKIKKLPKNMVANINKK